MNTNGVAQPVAGRKDRGISKAPIQRAQPTEQLPTFRMAYDNQVQVLRAYPAICGTTARPVTNGEIASLVGLAADTVSYTNPFFTAIGLLKRGENGNEPCPELMAYHNAHQWQPETAFHKLGPVFEATWFAQVLMPRLRFKEMTEEEAITELAAACSAGPKYRLRLKLLIKYLEDAGIIQRENGLLSLAKNGSPTLSVKVMDETRVNGEPFTDHRATENANKISTGFQKGTQGAIQLKIDINVDMVEMAKWSPQRITKFMEGLALVLAAKGEIERQESSN